MKNVPGSESKSKQPTKKSKMPRAIPLNHPCARLIVDLVPPLARMLRAEIAPAMGFGVSLAQFNLLSALAAHESCNNNELAEGLGVSLPVATRQVDNLVSMKLVARIRENGDRRQVRLMLTAKGRAVHQRVHERVTHALFSKLHELQPQDRNALEKGLVILRGLMSAMSVKTAQNEKVEVDRKGIDMVKKRTEKNRMSKINLVSSLALAFMISIATGCGPSQTSAQRDDAQIHADFVARQNALRPYVGNYFGTFTDSNGNVSSATLSLALAAEETATPGRGTSQSIAVLAGSLNECVANDVAPSCSYQVSNFSSGSPDTSSSTQHLYIQGTLGPVGANGTAAPGYMDLIVSGNRITGALTTSGNPVGSVDMIKQQ